MMLKIFILHLYCPSTPGMGTGLTNRPNSGIITVGATNDKFGYFTVTDDMPYNRKKEYCKGIFFNNYAEYCSSFNY